MMKHGVLVFALCCGLTAAVAARDVSYGSWQELTVAEQEAVVGGDLMLSVDRDRQMMTVTRITPGNYDNIQCYSVKVTTAVVRNQDVKPTNPKGAMESTARTLPAGKEQVFPKQFPTGTATLQPVASPQAGVTGLSIKTNATQGVTVVGADKKPTGQQPDSGYNIHYVDPAKATNTWGCVGVQSQDGMERLLESLKTDNASYPPGTDPKQTIIVNDYSKDPPPASTFAATETKPEAKKTEPKKTEPKKTGHPVARPLKAL